MSILLTLPVTLDVLRFGEARYTDMFLTEMTEQMNVCRNCGLPVLTEEKKNNKPDLEKMMDKESERSLLVFSPPNAKLKKKLGAYSLDLLAGSTCPGAGKCFSQAILKRNEDGVLTTTAVRIPPKVAEKGPEAIKKWEAAVGRETGQNIKCFAAGTQARSYSAFATSSRNEDLIRENIGDTEKMAQLITNSIDAQFGFNPPRFIRIHSYGDIFDEKYFQAWIEVANRMKQIIFYAYTKSTWWAVKHEERIPDNYRITLSLGGSTRSEKVIFDYIEQNRDVPTPKFKVAVIVKNKKQADELNMKIDFDETIAALPTTESNKYFALVEHPQSKDALLYIRPEILDIFMAGKEAPLQQKRPAHQPKKPEQDEHSLKNELMSHAKQHFGKDALKRDLLLKALELV